MEPKTKKSKSSSASNELGGEAEWNKPGKSKAIKPTQLESVKRSSSDALGDDVHCSSPAKRHKAANLAATSVEVFEKDNYRTNELDKKKRKMKNKALLKAVAEQMEFYFSDSNLSKDRFLRQLHDQTADGYVSLSVFRNFNKLLTILKEENYDKILYKALARSPFFELNEDHTKVRRSVPFVEIDQEEIDKRTIYVEHLPSHTSHTWLKKIFSQCGKVCYVSLPVYQSSKEMKGFAFIEFSSSEEATKACAMLNNPLPTKIEERPGKFPKGNKFLYRAEKIAPGIKTEEHDSNEENLQSDLKEAETASPLKKKKKKSSKRKIEEDMDDQISADPSECSNEKGEIKNLEEMKNDQSQPEKKKKRRKKKKRTDDDPIKEEDLKERHENQITQEQNQSLQLSRDHTIMVNKAVMEEDENMSDKEAIKKLKKKNRKKLRKLRKESESAGEIMAEVGKETRKDDESLNEQKTTDVENSEIKLSRKERKLLRQEDIRKKKAERATNQIEKNNDNQSKSVQSDSMKEDGKFQSCRARLDSVVSESSETDDSSAMRRKSDGSQLTSCLVKSRKQDVVKKVEFDPVPITTEFIERKEVRRRKKQKRESLHLRVISKKEWLSLREVYIKHQKSHMAALKETLRELRMQDNANQPPKEANGTKHVDLTKVFGTKRMKPSQDVKLAHLEELKFVPNVIVQWNSTHDINRNKIKTMFKEVASDCFAYIEGKEEANSGYIRFKDEESARAFAAASRTSDSFSARLLPKDQEAAYWEKANKARKEKLSKKKNERGSDRIARKVFERNKATFHEKGSHTVFNNEDEDIPSKKLGEENTTDDIQ